MDDIDNFDLLSAEKVAAKYGGDKRKIGEAAQMGLVNPTVAVMAGMFIDRMRAAAIQEQQPNTTVAQDTFTPPVQMAQAGLGATPQAQAASQMATAPTETRTLAKGGLSSLPVDEDMFPDEYAGGGIVAFANGGMSQMESDQAAMIDTLKRMGYSMADIATMVPRGLMGAFNAGVLRPARAITGLDIPYAKDILAPEGSNFSSMTPFYDQLRGSKKQTTTEGPMTGADLRKMDPAEMALRSAPGLTPAQSAANIAEARKERVVPKDESSEKVDTAKAAKATAPSKEETTEDFLAKRKRMLRESGVSEDPFAADREALRARINDIASQDKENKALAMIMGGLGGVNARNLAEFAQKAGTAGFGQYMKGKEKTREEQKEIDKINRDINRAEDAMKRGDVDKALEFEDKAAQRQIQLRGVQAQERAAGRPTSTAELLAALQSPDPAVRRAAETVLGSAKTGQVDERFLRDQWGKMKPLDKMLLERQGIKTFEQWAATQGYPVGGAAGGAAGMGTDPLGLRGGR